jgi:hypothetical protein
MNFFVENVRMKIYPKSFRPKWSFVGSIPEAAAILLHAGVVVRVALHPASGDGAGG